MKRRRVLFIQLSQFRLFLRKLVVMLVVISAFGLVVLSKADNAHLNKTEDLISRVLNPVIRVIQLPADGIYFVYEHIRDVARVYADNKVLQDTALRAEHLQNRLRALKIENDLLSDMLDYTPPPSAEFITAKVIAGEGDGFSHSLIVYVPDNQFVQKGQVVLYKQGVIGRIDSVHGVYARVMLISDINSKIPVIMERSRDKGILSGNNTSVLNLLFTSPGADIQKGDHVVTSGVGGIFPSDLLIGYVDYVANGVVEVLPVAPLEKIEYVRIVHYQLEETTDEEGNEQ